MASSQKRAVHACSKEHFHRRKYQETGHPLVIDTMITSRALLHRANSTRAKQKATLASSGEIGTLRYATCCHHQQQLHALKGTMSSPIIPYALHPTPVLIQSTIQGITIHWVFSLCRKPNENTVVKYRVISTELQNSRALCTEPPYSIPYISISR